jgi:uncharacterized protein (TIGR01777 family)
VHSHAATRPCVLVTGATGLVGRRLVTALRRDGIAVRALTRDPAAAARRLDPEIARFGWDGARVPADAVAGTSGVVHLAGEPVFAGRLTQARRRRIRTSRVESTRSVVEAFGTLPASERPAVFACASAVGFYGSRGEERLDEDATPGGGFLAEVCQEWESSAFAAETRGVRTVALRIGIALAREGGALPRMALPFRLGAGGRLGSGRQWFPWIHIDDLTSMVESVLRDDAYRGPVNAVAPEPVRNAELTRSLASALRRPALLAVPAFALRLALGELSEELLGSRRVVPRRALDRSFSFEHPSIATAIAEELRAGEVRPPGNGDPLTRGG